MKNTVTKPDVGHNWGTNAEPDLEANIGPTLQIE